MSFIKRNCDRIFLVVVLLSLLIALASYALNTIKKPEELQLYTVIDQIDGYDYQLTVEDGKLYKNYFFNLKEVLSNDEINYEEYAKLVAQLFAIDFYTLNNKVTNMDIGGIQFVSSSIVDNFILKATDTVYKYIKSNIGNDRKQELPEVSNVVVTDYNYENDKYIVTMSLEYVDDLEYPDTLEVILKNENSKLVIISVK